LHGAWRVKHMRMAGHAHMHGGLPFAYNRVNGLSSMA